NVLTGKRWKVIPKEIRQYFLGYYGQPPAPVDKEVQKLAIGDEEPITCRPGEKIAPEMEQARKDAEPWATEPEDALTWVMFPQVAKDFLPKKYARVHKRDVGLQEQVHEAAYPA
ncbi:MAG: oxaloacetate decarboxylase subunit alpha, partial [Synergistaceae bacterium]|nr:oxaloacetate decarboxylase subunit alpha [Synergistaceae bacterium]